MINIIKQLLLKVIQDIDAGNSNIDENEAIEIMTGNMRIKQKVCINYLILKLRGK